MADPFKDGSGNFTYGFIADEANVLEDNGLITSSATESLDYGLVADPILYSVQLTGISLTAEAGSIAEIVSDQIQITGINADITAENIAASGIQSPSIALSGIDLLGELGEITEKVIDSELISGIDLSIFAQNISASGIANPITVLNGIRLQSRAASISAIGEQTSTDIATGGEFVRPKMERSAKALVQSTRAVAYAGRVTPRGFTVINGGARVFTLESYTQIGQTEAVGELGIDEESLLMLLVA